MKKRIDALATLSPGASEMVQRLIRHLDGDPDAGAYLILGRRVEQGTEVEALGWNISRTTLIGGAGLACTSAIDSLRRCGCGRCHAAEIAGIERALALLDGRKETLQ
jgi:hypothetical protein